MLENASDCARVRGLVSSREIGDTSGMHCYYCRAMNVCERTPEYRRLASPVKLSKRAAQRLKWFDYYQSHGENARLTCRYFGISPQTFYRWKRRYSGSYLERLEDRSRRPMHVRQPCYSVELIEAVHELREKYPRRGKDKLAVLLHDKGCCCSVSTVGRILRWLKKRGV